MSGKANPKLFIQLTSPPVFLGFSLQNSCEEVQRHINLGTILNTRWNFVLLQHTLAQQCKHFSTNPSIIPKMYSVIVFQQSMRLKNAQMNYLCRRPAVRIV